MEQLAQIIEQIAQHLNSRQWRLATAESCTGGWIAKCCTDVAGSSNWFESGFVTYSNEAKCSMLGVSSKSINHFGAVSEQVVQEMANGARLQSRADIAVAVSGIAGPGGGSKEKPVGMVCLAWAANGMDTITATEYFHGDRDAVRQQAVQRALNGVLDLVSTT